MNTDDRFIQDMADMVIEALEAPVLSLTEATQNLDVMDDQGDTAAATTSMNAYIVKGGKQATARAESTPAVRLGDGEFRFHMYDA